MPGFGRIPSPPDSRDVPAALLLDPPHPRTLTAARANAVDVALAAYEHTQSQALLLTWMRLVTASLTGTKPTPVPDPQPTARLWRAPSDPILDQGNTGHCVGFSGAGFLADPEPRMEGVTDELGHELYYGCKDVDADGSVNRESGSYVRTLAKVLRARGRIDLYAWARTGDEITRWLLTRGPVVVGTDWYSRMMDPDEHGIVHPQGNIVGGHAYLLVGVVDADWQPTTSIVAGHTFYVLQNSWGRGWGRDGLALVDVGDFNRTLLARDGEAMVTVELPLPTALPTMFVPPAGAGGGGSGPRR